MCTQDVMNWPAPPLRVTVTKIQNCNWPCWQTVESGRAYLLKPHLVAVCCRESAASRLALSLSPFVSWVSAALKMKQLISNGDVVIPDGEPAAGPMRRPHRPQTQGTCCAHRSLRWISLLASLRAWDRTCSGRQQDKQQVAAACRLLGCSTTVRPQAANRSSFG